MLEAREIDYKNLLAVAKLSVSAAQDKYVAPNAYTIAQYHYEPAGWIRGLFAGDEAVGLMAMMNPADPSPSWDEDDPKDGGFLWRLMIDQAHQGNGYGRQAVDFAKAQCQRWGYQKLYTSAVPGDLTPIPFYESCGMRLTGRMLDGEAELVCKL